MFEDYDIEADIVEERVYRVGSRRFSNKQEAIEYRENRLLDEFVKGTWGPKSSRSGGYLYGSSDSLSAQVLAKRSGEHIGKLMHHVKTVMTRQDMPAPEGGLVNISLDNDPRINQDVATELLMEAIWRVMLGQKSVSRDSFKKKVEENPDLFYKGLVDLVELYAWQRLERAE